MNDQARRFDEDMDNLRALLEKVTKECKPKEHAHNRAAQQARLILVGYQEVGAEAITGCGWRFASPT